MATEESLRNRLIRRVRAPLLEALATRYGAPPGPACLEVALNVLRSGHLAASDLNGLAGDPLAEAEQLWMRDQWARACQAVLDSEPVQDCAQVIQAREAGPGQPAFDDFLATCWERLQFRARRGLFSDKPKLAELLEDDWLRELAEDRLFRTYSEAQDTLQRLRGIKEPEPQEDDSAAKTQTNPLSRNRSPKKPASGHHFQDALMDYDPELHGHWKDFLKKRFGWKLQDAARALDSGPDWEPLAPNDQDLEQATDPHWYPNEPNPPVSPSCETADHKLTVLALRFSEVRKRLRDRLINQDQTPTQGHPTARQVENERIADESLAVLEISYTAYVDPETYSEATRRLTPSLAERFELESWIELLQTRLEETPGNERAKTPRFDPLKNPAKELASLIQRWAEFLGRANPKEAAAIRAELEQAAAAGQSLPWTELTQQQETALELAAQTLPAADRRSVVRVLITLLGACVSRPALDELRDDYHDSVLLCRRLVEQLGEARNEQTVLEALLEKQKQHASEWDIRLTDVGQAEQLGRQLAFAPKTVSDAERAEVKELEATLEADNRRLRAQALSSGRRRELEFKCFQLAQQFRPVEAFETELKNLERRINPALRQDQRLVPPALLETFRRRMLLARVTLASVRLANAEQRVERLHGPDSNLRRYEWGEKFKEPDLTSPDIKDRPHRFWRRSQRNVMRLLPGMGQAMVSRRLGDITEPLPSRKDTSGA